MTINKLPEPKANNPYFDVKKSKIQGYGSFAKVDIPKGTSIIQYVGELISEKEANRRYNDAAMRRHHTFLFALGNNKVIDGAVGGNESIYMNHCCEPNCEPIQYGMEIYVETIKDVKKGEELVYDYKYERHAEHTEEDEKLYKCLCGKPTCRGTILAPEISKMRKRKKKKKESKPVKSISKKDLTALHAKIDLLDNKTKLELVTDILKSKSLKNSPEKEEFYNKIKSK